MPVHNFAIAALNRRIAESLAYEGRVVDLGCGDAPYRELILARGAIPLRRRGLGGYAASD